MPFWSKICFPFILLVALLTAPFVNLRTYVFEDKDEFLEGDEDWFDRFIKPFKKFVMEDRDSFLRTILAEEILEEKNKGKKLCVKYGEKHMKALSETLLKDFDYELTKRRDVLAIARNKSLDLTEINTGYNIAYHKLWKIKEKQDDTPIFWEAPPNHYAQKYYLRDPSESCRFIP